MANSLLGGAKSGTIRESDVGIEILVLLILGHLFKGKIDRQLGETYVNRPVAQA